MPLDQPRRVVDVPKRQKRVAQILDRVDALHPEQVLLERADEALSAAVAFRCTDEGRRTRDAQDLLISAES